MRRTLHTGPPRTIELRFVEDGKTRTRRATVVLRLFICDAIPFLFYMASDVIDLAI